MNTYGIDKRVWNALFGPGPREAAPSEVALAASICPEVLEEGIAWKSYRALRLTEDSPIALQCGTPYMQVRNALAAWVMDQSEAQLALKYLAKWDRKLGVWCAVACAETALGYISADEKRPRIALETARAWVRGKAFAGRVRAVGRNAMEAFEGTSAYVSASEAHARGATAYAVYDAQKGVFQSYNAAIHAISAGIYAPGMQRPGGDSYFDSFNEENERLKQVIAQAVIDYPTAEAVKPSRGLSRNTLAVGIVGAMIGAGAMHAAKNLKSMR